ncbi:hypothetical protein LY05_00297 [Oceanicella actignis]|nr:hypothetical protein LY05_00297 [Oceanicella actignis]
MTIRAEIVDGGACVELHGDVWRGRIGADEIDAWIDLYKRLRDRRRGRYAEKYAPALTELLRARKTLAEMCADHAEGEGR